MKALKTRFLTFPSSILEKLKIEKLLKDFGFGRFAPTEKDYKRFQSFWHHEGFYEAKDFILTKIAEQIIEFHISQI